MEKISLCIPTKNRFNFLSRYLDKYVNFLEENIIDEIIISDETGEDYEKIKEKYQKYINKGIFLYKNDKILGVFLNKLKVCSYANNNIIVLIDSDNFADRNYFMKIHDYINKIDKNLKSYILSPSFAKPRFNYTEFNNSIITKNNINLYINNPNFMTLLNTGNYVITKNIILKILQNDFNLELDKISSSDVLYFNLLVFEQIENFELHILENLHYDHVVHDDSEYLKTHKYCGDYFNKHISHRYYKLF